MKNLFFIVNTEVIEGDIYWTAQCIGYDFCVQSRSLEKLELVIYDTIFANIILALKDDEVPFHEYESAPKEFHDALLSANFYKKFVIDNPPESSFCSLAGGWLNKNEIEIFLFFKKGL